MALVRSTLRRSRRAAGKTHAVQETHEIYLLSGAGDNVKVRDALMDVKVLREVNADGLEQWTPLMKAPRDPCLSFRPPLAGKRLRLGYLFRGQILCYLVPELHSHGVIFGF